MSNVRFTGRINDGTTSYTVVSKSDCKNLGRVTNIQPGVWGARVASRVFLGEYSTRAEAGEAIWQYYRDL